MKHPQGKYHTIFQLICMLALAFLGFGCGKTYNGESAEYYKKALAWEVVSLQRARQELKKHQAATCIDVSVIQSGVTPIDSNGSGYIYIYIDCDVENKSDLHITGFRYTATLLQHGVTIQHESARVELQEPLKPKAKDHLRWMPDKQQWADSGLQLLRLQVDGIRNRLGGYFLLTLSEFTVEEQVSTTSPSELMDAEMRVHDREIKISSMSEILRKEFGIDADEGQ